MRTLPFVALGLLISLDVILAVVSVAVHFATGWAIALGLAAILIPFAILAAWKLSKDEETGSSG